MLLALHYYQIIYLIDAIIISVKLLTGGMKMDINKSIKCTVEGCQHHANTANYCSLDCITIGAHERNPKMDQCTDCLSFERK